METVVHTESVPVTGGGVEKPATLIGRFQRHIETSDWDERIVRGEPLFNRICLVTVTLSGMALLSIMISVLVQ